MSYEQSLWSAPEGPPEASTVFLVAKGDLTVHRSAMKATILCTETSFPDEATVLPGRRKFLKFLQRVSSLGGTADRRERKM